MSQTRRLAAILVADIAARSRTKVSTHERAGTAISALNRPAEVAMLLI